MSHYTSNRKIVEEGNEVNQEVIEGVTLLHIPHTTPMGVKDPEPPPGRALTCHDEMKSNSQIDLILPYSCLRCLCSEEFISVLNDEECAEFFNLPSLIAAALIWFHKDEISHIRVDILLVCIKNFVIEGLSLSKKNIANISNRPY